MFVSRISISASRISTSSIYQRARPARSRRASSSSAASTGRPTARRSRSITGRPAIRRTAAAPTSRWSTWRRGAKTALVTQNGPDSNPTWSPDGYAHRLCVVDGQAVLLLPEQRHRGGAGDGRRHPEPHRSVRRESGADRMDESRPGLLCLAAHVGVSVHARSRRPGRSPSTRYANSGSARTSR